MDYAVQREQESRPMPLEVEGVTYFASAEVARVVGVSRQTLWRWRQEGKIPAGRRYRDRQVLFTEKEMEAIRQYAHRIEPLSNGSASSGQLGLFPKGTGRNG